MKKILTLIVLALFAASAVAAAAEPVNEVTVILGNTVKTHPAGFLLQGATVSDGAEFIKLETIHHGLSITGVKEGLATVKLSYLGGKTAEMRVRVATRAAQKPEAPKWTGPYALNIPKDNYCISYAELNSNEVEDIVTTIARIGDIFVSSSHDIDEDWNVFNKFEYNTRLGYNGGFTSEKSFMYMYGDGASLDDPNGKKDGEAWFEEYAPAPEEGILHAAFPLCLFGWDNQNNDRYETGIVMQRMRQYGRQQSYLQRFYRGEETVCGVKCWVFDMRGQGSYGVGDLCWWIDPETGLALKCLDENGSGMVVLSYDLNYSQWDIVARPELYL